MRRVWARLAGRFARQASPAATLAASGLFDVAWDGAIARPLLACAKEISRKLGYRA